MSKSAARIAATVTTDMLEIIHEWLSKKYAHATSRLRRR